MSVLKTPKGFRIHIGIFGRRNVGKSSLLNVLVGQSISIVSPTPGTTTDPVEKAMELQPIGPVVFIDTAGVDDIGALGGKRVEKTIKILERTDLAILVTEANIWTDFERGLIQKFEEYEIPYLVVFNKIDKIVKPGKIDINENVKVVYTSAVSKVGIDELRQAIIETIPDEYFRSRPIIGDLINPGDLVVLVVPIDKEAPKGRLILPQVQTIRDILDHNGYCIVVKENELKSALENLKTPPAITVTDSQVFDIVNQMVPEHIPLTSFSILYARQKGDLREFVKGVYSIKNLKDCDKVLIAEACTHHPIADDIGRVKIPNWLKQYTGLDLKIDVFSGHDFPENLSEYKLVIHCGACMFNRKEVLTRIYKCKKAGVPITNYGVTISFLHGILNRALKPFKEVRDIIQNQR